MVMDSNSEMNKGVSSSALGTTIQWYMQMGHELLQVIKEKS